MSRFAKEDDVTGLTFAQIAAKPAEEAVVETGVVADPATLFHLLREDSTWERSVALVAADQMSIGRP